MQLWEFFLTLLLLYLIRKGSGEFVLCKLGVWIVSHRDLAQFLGTGPCFLHTDFFHTHICEGVVQDMAPELLKGAQGLDEVLKNIIFRHVTLVCSAFV